VCLLCGRQLEVGFEDCKGLEHPVSLQELRRGSSYLLDWPFITHSIGKIGVLFLCIIVIEVRPLSSISWATARGSNQHSSNMRKSCK
jgi:hypothetical protein